MSRQAATKHLLLLEAVGLVSSERHGRERIWRIEAEPLTDASDYLTGIIQTARAGRWQPAAEKLYRFMSVQRRDATAESTPQVHAKTRTRAGKR